MAVAILGVGPAGAALACGGLIAPNGTISLTRTTTLAAYQYLMASLELHDSHTFCAVYTQYSCPGP